MTRHVLAAILGAAQNTSVPLDRARAVAMAAVLSALADPVRLQVFRAVREAGDSGASLRDILAPGGDRATIPRDLPRLGRQAVAPVPCTYPRTVLGRRLDRAVRRRPCPTCHALTRPDVHPSPTEEPPVEQPRSP